MVRVCNMIVQRKWPHGRGTTENRFLLMFHTACDSLLDKVCCWSQQPEQRNRRSLKATFSLSFKKLSFYSILYLLKYTKITDTCQSSGNKIQEGFPQNTPIKQTTKLQCCNLPCEPNCSNGYFLLPPLSLQRNDCCEESADQKSRTKPIVNSGFHVKTRPMQRIKNTYSRFWSAWEVTLENSGEKKGTYRNTTCVHVVWASRWREENIGSIIAFTESSGGWACGK